MSLQFKAPSRLVAVDIVRVSAMVLMVQGHTLDVLLTPAYQFTPWYNYWVFCRGFTAPMFMTLSGFGFALATLRRWEGHLQFGPAVAKRLRRFAFFVLLGYSMRIPVHSLRDLRWAGPDAWHEFLQVDVLQAIGFTLIALQLLVLVLRSPRRFATVTGMLALIVAFTAPLAWRSPFLNSLPLAVKSALIGTTGSLFPLMPWSAYIFLGATFGIGYVEVGQSIPSLLRKAIPFGLLLLVSGIGLEGVSLHIFGQANFWPTTPHLFIARIGFVTASLGLATFVERFLPVSPRTMQSLAEESLFVYFVHVVLLYGSCWNPGIKQYIGGTMGFAHAYLLVILLVGVMMMTALYWNRAKRNYPLPSLVLRLAVVGAAALAVA
ncbi:MAG: heparan-alpha-glucosaminide N-acetyltransferase domain-containing protein [Terriglobia bacterium]